MSIRLQEHLYEFSKEVRRDPHLREGFMQIARETFGIDFHPWLEQGYWGDAFVPYVLTYQGQVVASVCVNLIFGRITSQNMGREPSPRKLFVQLGGVITAKEHRGRGLSRWLIEKVLEEWREKADGIYLYANDSVLDFYPKFGFVKEQEFQASVVALGPAQPMRKIDLTSEEDLTQLKHCYEQGNPYAAFQVEYFNLMMFYLLGPYKDCVYYVPEQQTLLIAKQEAGAWHCFEILGSSTLPLPQLLGVLNPDQPTRLELGFQAQSSLDFSVQPLHEEDTTFFVLEGKERPFTSGFGRMPVLSRA